MYNLVRDIRYKMLKDSQRSYSIQLIFHRKMTQATIPICLLPIYRRPDDSA